MDLRARFRNSINNIKETHHADFVKIGKEKESERVATAGKESSGARVYGKMKNDMEVLKQKLKE